jgi:hypothetical protein
MNRLKYISGVKIPRRRRRPTRRVCRLWEDEGKSRFTMRFVGAEIEVSIHPRTGDIEWQIYSLEGDGSETVFGWGKADSIEGAQREGLRRMKEILDRDRRNLVRTMK